MVLSIYHPRFRQFFKGVKQKRGYSTLVIALLVFYQGRIFASIFDLSLELQYASVSISFFLIYILYCKDHLKINRYLFLSIITMLISLLIGFWMGWYPRDILADVVRYIAPFLGFTAGLYIFGRLQYERVIYFIFFISTVELIIYCESVFGKIYHVIHGSPLIEYAKHGLNVSGFYFFLFICFLKKRMLNRVGKFLAFCYTISFFISPILLMSKARTITMLFSTALVCLFVVKRRTGLIIVIAFLVCIFTGIKYLDTDHVFSRTYAAIELLQSGEYSKDPSTGVRIAEISNILDQLNKALPYSILFGMGSGALHFETAMKVEGGRHAEDVRKNGGVHDIYTIFFGYLFRYGVIGFGLVLFWTGFVMKKLIKCIKHNKEDPFKYSICLSVILYILYAFLSDNFVAVYVYGNFHYGLILAIAFVVAHHKNPVFKARHIKSY